MNPPTNKWLQYTQSFLLHRSGFLTLLSFAHGYMWGYMRCFAEESQERLKFVLPNICHSRPRHRHILHLQVCIQNLDVLPKLASGCHNRRWEPLLLNSSSRPHKLIPWIFCRLVSVLWPSQLVRRILWINHLTTDFGVVPFRPWYFE